MQMKTILPLILLVLLVTVSCKKDKPSAQDILYDEVIADHDEIMVKMGDIMKYKKQVNNKLDKMIEVGGDSTSMNELRKTIADLENSHDEMMNWMHGFSNDFENKTEEEIMKYLNDQKQKIEAVGKMTNQALEHAEKILDE
jgi:paraquat-inducible protein B